MSVNLWNQPQLAVSAEFGLGGLSLGVYDAADSVLATMRGPLIGLTGTSPLRLDASTAEPVILVNFAADRFGHPGHGHSGRFLVIDRPDGSRIGSVYVRSFARGVVYGLYDHVSQTDVGWMSSQDPQLQVFRLDDASGAVLGWIQIAHSELHALSSSKQSWYVSLHPQLDDRLGPLVLGAVVVPPTLLRNTLTH